MNFRLKSGTHVEGGKSYKAGDKITSALDLATIFVNKFDVLEDEDSANSQDNAETNEPSEETAEVEQSNKETPNAEESLSEVSEKEEKQNTSEKDTSETLLEKNEDAPEKLAGDNVTSEFENAVKNNIKVHKEGSWYSIYDSEDSNLLIGGKKVRKAGVESAIDIYLKGCE